MSNQEESHEEVQRIKYELWAETPEIELEAASVEKKLVAEGDSWFDYPPRPGHTG